MYDLAALETALSGSIFAGKLHYSEATDSTNNDAVEAARAGAPQGSAYFADEQLAGRGRGGNTWHSAAGDGLYVSVLLRPRLPVAHLPLLPLAAGLAAADAVRAVSGLVADLRWPNDILLGPRKAGGILVEAHTERRAVAWAVIGMGINVHQREFPPGLATPATSLDLEAGRRISRQPLLAALLKFLEREALALEDQAACAAIPARVEQASTWVRGRVVEVHGPQACTGLTAGLDANGFLQVQTKTEIVTAQTGGIREAAFSH
jgi:BirA family biotin operon repressor/biotin-[acetyl-CoA-carboxylase] ligase